MEGQRFAAVGGACLETGDFQAFYRDSLPHVYGYLLHRVGGAAGTAEDLTQETYLAAVRQLSSGDSGDGLSLPWLIGVARHKLVDHFRRLDREERKLNLVSAQPEPDEDLLSGRGRRQEVEEALADLPALHRAALVLRYVDDLPVGEVARTLNKTMHATESLLARARRSFRCRLEERDDE